MFSHHDRRGKCEWFEGLAEFVSHYNRKVSTHYERTECLDIVRIGGSTAKQPEVLLTDSTDGKRMVIERKSVQWPLDYILRHNNEHIFAETFTETIRAETAGRFKDAYYELWVSARQMGTFDTKKVRDIAKQIGSRIGGSDSSELPLKGAQPVGWTFGLATDDEDGDRKGIAVIHSDSISLEDFGDESAKIGTAAEMQNQLEAASLKFADYSDATRLVLLDFFGTELFEDDIVALMPSISIPLNIDEVWMTAREWVSENDFEVGYRGLFCRHGAATA